MRLDRLLLIVALSFAAASPAQTPAPPQPGDIQLILTREPGLESFSAQITNVSDQPRYVSLGFGSYRVLWPNALHLMLTLPDGQRVPFEEPGGYTSGVGRIVTVPLLPGASYKFNLVLSHYLPFVGPVKLSEFRPSPSDSNLKPGHYMLTAEFRAEPSESKGISDPLAWKFTARSSPLAFDIPDVPVAAPQHQ